MNLSFYSRRNYAKTIAGTLGLSYRERQDCRVPHASASSIVVPPYSYEFSKEEETTWWYSFIHECYHHTHPEDFVFLKSKQIKHDMPIVGYNNCVCDYKIERNNYGDMPGRDRLMEEGRVHTLRSLCKSAKKSVSEQVKEALASGELPADKEPTPEQVAKAQDEKEKKEALIFFDNEVRKQWQVGTHEFSRDDLSSDVVKQHFDKLMSAKGLQEQYHEVQTPEDQWEVARRITNILEGSEDAADKQEQQMQGRGNPEDGEGEGEDGVMEAVRKIMYKDIDWEDRHEAREQHHANSEIDYSDYDERPEYVVRDPKIVTFNKGISESFKYGNDSYGSSIRNTDTGNSLSNAISKYLITMKKGRWEHGKTVGKVSKRNVWKAKHLAGTQAARKIHRKHVIKNDVGAAVSIVIDQSGSMSGSKYIHASHSAVMLNNVFNRLQVPFEIIAFTDYNNQPVNVLHKHFGQRIQSDTLIDQMVRASSKMSGNSDGESIMWAAERLLQRTEKKRIMLVLSDGQPAGSGGLGIDAFTQDVIKNLEKHIQVHGIGIESSNVKRYYKSNCVINSPEELEPALLNVLKTKVLE